MAEPRFADDDDLPRTLRREREAREREMRERELPDMSEDGFGSGAQRRPAQSYAHDYGASGGRTGVVTRLEIPFGHLVKFFLKAVVAAIPALILLTVLLWGMGQGLKAFFPQFRHFEIVIKSTSP
jgi:hypothetical protein